MPKLSRGIGANQENMNIRTGVKGVEKRYCFACVKGAAKKSFTENQLCSKHLQEVKETVAGLLELFEGNFEEMIATMIALRSSYHHVNPTVLNNLLSKKMKWILPLLTRQPTKTGGRFNTTQALKRFCREKYKENPKLFQTKPPKNSKSKIVFVAWAKENNLDLSCFKTRPYKKKQLIGDLELSDNECCSEVSYEDCEGDKIDVDDDEVSESSEEHVQGKVDVAESASEEPTLEEEAICTLSQGFFDTTRFLD